MRVLGMAVVVAGGWMLVAGGNAWGQDAPCAIPPCMKSILGQPAVVSSAHEAAPVAEQRSPGRDARAFFETPAWRQPTLVAKIFCLNWKSWRLRIPIPSCASTPGGRSND